MDHRAADRAALQSRTCGRVRDPGVGHLPALAVLCGDHPKSDKPEVKTVRVLYPNTDLSCTILPDLLINIPLIGYEH